MDPGELHPEGWFGYAFDFTRTSNLVAGMSLAEVEHELDGLPVARCTNADHTRSWIWYFETQQALDAVELVFGDDGFLRVGDSDHEKPVNYGGPVRLQSWTWCMYSTVPNESGNQLLLRPSKIVRAGFGYDRDATRLLAPGTTTLADAERMLGGRPAWIVHFEDGSKDVVWWQQTPTMGSSFRGQFDREDVLQSALWDHIISGAMPGLRDWNDAGSPRAGVDPIWK